MILQLRPIAGIVALAVALPLMTAGGMSDLLRTTALGLFVVSFVVWTALFYWLRTSMRVGRGTYLLCGLALGVLPAAFLFLVSRIFNEATPSITVLAVGVATGLLAGLALQNLSPFERKHG